MSRHKSPRAARISPTLTPEVVALAKGMLSRGDRQSDISAYFGFNQGRLYDIRHNPKFAGVAAALPCNLPESGPYVVVPKLRHERATAAAGMIEQVMRVMERATADIRSQVRAALQENL